MKVSMRVLDPADLDALGDIAPEVATAAGMLVATGNGWASRILVDDVPAGVATLTLNGEVALYLEPQFQRLGVGSCVLKSVVSRAKVANLSRVYARARLGSGGAALARKVGLVEVGQEGSEAIFELTF